MPVLTLCRYGQSKTTEYLQPCSPDLTSFEHVLLVHRTKISTLVEDYQRLAVKQVNCTVAADLRVVTMHNRISHRQVIHILHFIAGSYHKGIEPDD